ncbi:hypothetical protein HMPREF0972_01908 [Actinomyces sp. oral taxon 848 str. F0332]|nr:hypothetical protein HMPREF0972_01908 [Actinomyces sp. oral taxon 848 str. F0332]
MFDVVIGDPIDDFLAAAIRFKEPGVAQDPQMLRCERLAHLRRLGESRNRPVLVAHK